MKQLDSTLDMAALRLKQKMACIQSRPCIRLAWFRLAKDEAGGTLVEYAVSLTLLLTVIFGIMDCSRALYFDHYVRYSAEEASRYAMVRGSTWSNVACTTTQTEDCTATGNDVTNKVISMSSMGSASALSVVTTWTGKTPAGSACKAANGNNSPGCVVQVKVSYSFNFTLPFLPKNALLLSSTSAVAISQ